MTRKGAVSARRIALGVCCLLVATVSFVTLTLNLIPAEPVASQPVVKQLRAGNYAPSMEPESIVDVQFGSAFECDGVVCGKRFAFSEEDRASWTKEQLERMEHSDGWELRYEGLVITVSEAEVLGGEEFLSLYPGYRESNPSYEYGREFKAVLVRLAVSNGASEERVLPEMLLWDKDFRGASNITGNGLRPDKYALAEIAGKPQEGAVQLALRGDWNVVGAGESRVVTLAYTVDEALFSYGNDYEALCERD
ncbi:MAG: hypothetical protein IJC51_00440, partial [Eggerthellaceae bacterium]|nr:hypothetical protein [Eggerthellaceae bacterium]